MLLIYPPIAKPCEPPAGIAKLCGALQAHGIPCRVLDANLEGLQYLMERQPPATDTWSRRALKNVSRNLASVKDPQAYRSFDRYARAVKDLNRAVEVSALSSGAVTGLADYRHARLSPLRSADLLASAENPEQNPFFPYFSQRLPKAFGASSDAASTAPHGHEVKMAGVSLNYLSQALTAFAMIGFIRKRYPGMKIVLGGGLVTSWLKRPGWSNPFAGFVDHLVAGPGEGALLSLSHRGGGCRFGRRIHFVI